MESAKSNAYPAANPKNMVRCLKTARAFKSAWLSMLIDVVAYWYSDPIGRVPARWNVVNFGYFLLVRFYGGGGGGDLK